MSLNQLLIVMYCFFIQNHLLKWAKMGTIKDRNGMYLIEAEGN